MRKLLVSERQKILESLLQFGRIVNDAETVAPMCPAVRAEHASIRPHRERCGNTFFYLSFVNPSRRLQFGRIVNDAETSGKQTPPPLPAQLQFGRIVNDAETTVPDTPDDMVTALQFGRIVNDAETKSQGQADAERAERASIRPHRERCGNREA